MKKLLFLLVMGFMANALAGLPEIPEECIDDVADGCYYSQSDVVMSEELGRNVIRVNFFASIPDWGDYEDETEILDKFLDFDSWGSYTTLLSQFNGNVKKALKDNPMVVAKSIRLADTVDYEGYEAIVNHAYYYTALPFPVNIDVNNSRIVERALYFEIEPVDGALLTWKFVGDPSYSKGDMIDFDGEMKKITGIKYKKGTLSLAYDEDEEAYLAFVEIDVIPAIDLLPSIGAPYVEASLESVFVGMFIDN